MKIKNLSSREVKTGKLVIKQEEDIPYVINRQKKLVKLCDNTYIFSERKFVKNFPTDWRGDELYIVDKDVFDILAPHIPSVCYVKILPNGDTVLMMYKIL